MDVNMNVIYKAMGPHGTNCYIISDAEHSIIIDPGINSTQWVIENAKNPVAILNTHGHFDHIWSNQELKEHFQIPLYVPKDDVFMLDSEQFGMQVPPSIPDIIVENGESFELAGFNFKFHHFPGHTPGTSMIEFDDCCFSGDFIFHGSVGRTDFPFSNPNDMKKSIQNFINDFNDNKIIYPGHNGTTNVLEAKSMLPRWLMYLDN
jgi:glyoxylase-like metal-dependent hydrolase (beta-lactamase superfamily II)